MGVTVAVKKRQWYYQAYRYENHRNHNSESRVYDVSPCPALDLWEHIEVVSIRLEIWIPWGLVDIFYAISLHAMNNWRETFK